MFYKWEKSKIGIKTYVILSLLLTVYFSGFTFIAYYNTPMSLTQLSGEGLLFYLVGIPIGIVISIFLLKKTA